MTSTREVLLAVVLAAGWWSAAWAQGWDASAFAGVVGAHAPIDEPDGYHQNWFHAAQGGLTLGRYFTPHLKIEIEGGVSGTGTQFTQRFVTAPGYPAPFPVGAEAQTSLRWVDVSAVWQFFDNQWVHPFLSAGVVATEERRRIHTWAQEFYGTGPRVPGNAALVVPDTYAGPDSTTSARGVLGAGVKLYISPRVFFRGDTRVALGRERQHVGLRGGMGVDF